MLHSSKKKKAMKQVSLKAQKILIKKYLDRKKYVLERKNYVQQGKRSRAAARATHRGIRRSPRCLSPTWSPGSEILAQPN